MQGFIREIFVAALLTAGLISTVLALHHFDLLAPMR